ncbi:FadR/GntR family transcriptional regulator [Naumannella halotolerans]|uniref:GntR family transcriptional repressor for pyruvate dehydrogenase complex n=1 Tax=Naumannella halotolerans TaxID=993414 RepID=A0A4R7JCD9_9ACTN|nr:FadR/GntR family transcriptional regulator [Naumannella halotolerans]TDT34323.1 GntR family transcriptional repressor for pyruvate dehydrogenase complex [Naumannella halotolerans]
MPAYPPDRSSELIDSLHAIPTGSPVSEVAQSLLKLFTTGSIPPGTRLPPERQLAASLNVGRSAVREALAALELLGIVDVRPGSGTYLRGSASELLPQSLRWGLLIGGESTQELLELRAGLETYAARLAAERADEDGQAELAELVARMDRQVAEDLAAFSATDQEFHQRLAVAARNSVLLDLLHVTRSLLRVYADRAVQDRPGAERAVAEHRAILDAVARRDPDQAARAMTAHMRTATKRLRGEAG